LLVTAGWRSIFWQLFLLARILLIATGMKLPESRSEAAALYARLESRLAAYWAIVSNRCLLAHILAGGLSAAPLMTWYTGASPLFQDDFGWSPRRSSWVFGILGVGVIAATQINRSLLSRFSPRRIMVVALLMTLADLPGAHVIVAVGMILGVATYGFISANNQACAFERDRLRAGSISALIGAGNYGLGAIVAWVVTRLPSLQGASMIAMMAGELCAAWLILRLLNPTPAARYAVA
jgi:DHA1 family bicyclomycin/chloramphenicol resistance-like MFS transporter